VADRKLEVLVVDDDEAIRDALRLVLEHGGHGVHEAGTGDEAIALLDGRPVDAVLLDLNMPGMHGLEALERIREIAPDTAVIVVSGEATIANAMRAGQRGAYDFIEKPPDRDRLLGVLDEAARVTALRRRESGAPEVREPAPAAAGPGGDLGILGSSAAVSALLERIRKIGPAQGRVLVTGENGSGKELVAHALHVMSRRAGGPFVKINCAAIPRDLIESELFGYERGAFSGAVQAKKGRLEMADGGTLFLDEIGDLSLEAQAKLLRAIETGEVERVGGTRTAHVDVRIIAATNKDLTAAVGDGAFREDLYYRLNVLPIHVPPLRERASDVPLLAGHFLEGFCRGEGITPKTLAPEACGMLEEYHWPGNVRELRNLMERAAILVAGDTVEAGDLAPWLESSPEGRAGLRGEIEKREADAIRRALEEAGWNVTQAAAGLGIDRTNLHRKIRKYGISRR
jgi:two-component system nitrogen regulation response regulator NtrX